MPFPSKEHQFREGGSPGPGRPRVRPIRVPRAPGRPRTRLRDEPWKDLVSLTVHDPEVIDRIVQRWLDMILIHRDFKALKLLIDYTEGPVRRRQPLPQVRDELDDVDDQGDLEAILGAFGYRRA